jgi:cold shock CspA family protein
MTDRRHTGIVTFYDSTRRFGFVRAHDPNIGNVFIGGRVLADSRIKQVEKGDELSFDLTPAGDHKPIAIKIQFVD